MILTCPKCATGYFVDESQVGPGGRKVRCAACAERWTAYPVVSEPAPPLEAIAAPASGSLSGIELPRAFRSRAEEERRLRQAAATGAVWAGAAVALIAFIGAGILFRESVVRVWPQTASAYSVIGLPVNPTGLVIEDLRAEPSLQQGHAVLAVSGVIRNVVGREVTAPPLRVTLLNAQGKRVAGQIDAIANARVPPGEIRHFATAIVDPPFSAHDLSVDFALGAQAQALALRLGTQPSHPTAAAPLRGSTAGPAANVAVPPPAAPSNRG